MTDGNGIVIVGEKVEKRDINSVAGTYILSTQEAAFFYESLSSAAHTLRIQYQLIDIGEGEMACCPYHFDPDTVNMEDVSPMQYEINFVKSSNQITKVTNKQDGDVRFEAVKVDTDCGFVTSSIVELYTSNLSPGIFNIVHIHVDDMSEEIPIEAVYVLPEQDSAEYHEFNVDARGVQLRYKVLVQEGKVRTVLYNPGGGVVNDLPIIERPLVLDSMVKYGGIVAKIVKIPIGMLARNWESRDIDVPSSAILSAPIAFCNKRHVEDMPGLVELEVIHDGKKLVTGKPLIAVPICEIEPLTASDMRVFEEAKVSEEENRVKSIERSAKELQELVELMRQPDRPGAKEMMERLRETSHALREALKSQTETREYAGLLQQSDRCLRALAIDMRIQG